MPEDIEDAQYQKEWSANLEEDVYRGYVHVSYPIAYHELADIIGVDPLYIVDYEPTCAPSWELIQRYQDLHYRIQGTKPVYVINPKRNEVCFMQECRFGSIAPPPRPIEDIVKEAQRMNRDAERSEELEERLKKVEEFWEKCMSEAEDDQNKRAEANKNHAIET